MCISVYHLFFVFILAEFITACLPSNANSKGIRTSGFHGVVTILKLKASYLMLFPFFPSSWSAKLWTEMPCSLCLYNAFLDSLPVPWPWHVLLFLGSDLWGCISARSHGTALSALTKPLCFPIRAEVPTLSLKSKVCAPHMISLLFPPLHYLWSRTRIRVSLGPVKHHTGDLGLGWAVVYCCRTNFWQVVGMLTTPKLC